MNCLSVRLVVDMVDTNEERQMIDVPDGTVWWIGCDDLGIGDGNELRNDG